MEAQVFNGSEERFLIFQETVVYCIIKLLYDATIEMSRVNVFVLPRSFNKNETV